MSFLRDWLPITTRNRVALILAFAALAMFVAWNCLPNHEYAGDTEADGIVATSLWLDEIIDPGLYVMVYKDPDLEGFLGVAACVSLIQNALVTLAAVPFWRFLHASSYVRVPLAIANGLGGSVIMWHLFDNAHEERAPYWVAILLLMAGGMFALSAALFLFRNELALREERQRSEVPEP